MTAVATDERQRITLAFAALVLGAVAIGASVLILFGIYVARPRFAEAGP